MPNMSLFDSVAALELDQLSVAFVEGESLFNEMIFGEPNEEVGKAPLPLLRMWIGYEAALAAYTVAAAATLVRYGVTVASRSLALSQTVAELRRDDDPMPLVMPPWLTDTDVLRSHRSNLMRRWPDAYAWKGTPTNLPYLWPIVDDEGGYVLKLSKYDKGLIASGDRVLPKTIAERIVS
jgi:hypothetical protein